MQWQAKYEGVYLLGTSIARPLISKVCLQVAREVGANAYAHGATGKGNDQCRFQLAAEALDPSIKVIAPWRMEKFRKTFPGRTELIAYCNAKNIPVKASVSKPYSSDENCLHISYEAGKLEDLKVNGVDTVEFGMTVSPQKAPDKVEPVTISFDKGIPVSVNGKKLGPQAGRTRGSPPWKVAGPTTRRTPRASSAFKVFPAGSRAASRRGSVKSAVVRSLRGCGNWLRPVAAEQEAFFLLSGGDAHD